MSRRLRNFLGLLATDEKTRDETEMGTYVSWLRRRIALLKDLESSTVISLLRHSRHVSLDRDDIIYQQGKQRDNMSPRRFFIILKGSASMFINPFIVHGKTSSMAHFAPEKSLMTPSSLEKIKHGHKSASSKRTNQSKKSKGQMSDVSRIEMSDSDGSDVESDVSIETELPEPVKEETVDTIPGAPPGTPGTQVSKEDTLAPFNGTLAPINGPSRASKDSKTPAHTPISRASKHSRKDTPRTKLGKFVVKYEKGTYFEEEAMLDDDDCHTASIIADEKSEFIVIDDVYYNQYMREHHERTIMTITNFVDVHPFFRALPIPSKGVIQISLKVHHHETGHYIVRQGDPVDKLIFIVNGSAEVVMDPGKHRTQYPDFWPFETSNDVYFKECEWLRESRRRVYSRQYEYHGEVTRRLRRGAKPPKVREVRLCAVQRREVVGVTEAMLDLTSHMQSLRCQCDCEVYSLSLKPFRRVIRRRHSGLLELIRAYVQMKLEYHMNQTIGEQVPLLRCLHVAMEKQISDKSMKRGLGRHMEAMRQRERDMKELLDWFLKDKAPLIINRDPSVLQLKEKMQIKAARRANIRERTIGLKPYRRIGCLMSMKDGRQPLSLHRLRDPVNEVLLRLRMEGTFISDEEELESLLLRYSVPLEEDVTDVSKQTNTVKDEEYNLLRYRRHGNRLVRQFTHLLESRVSDGLPKQEEHPNEVEKDEFYFSNQVLGMQREAESVFDRSVTRATTRTQKSIASTYRPLQFGRRCVTPRTLDMKIKDFHLKYGGQEKIVSTLPALRRYNTDSLDLEESPLPGGRVFVTQIPCVSHSHNVHLKNHRHLRCQMLHSLPMDKVTDDTEEPNGLKSSDRPS